MDGASSVNAPRAPLFCPTAALGFTRWCVRAALRPLKRAGIVRRWHEPDRRLAYSCFESIVACRRGGRGAPHATFHKKPMPAITTPRNGRRRRRPVRRINPGRHKTRAGRLSPHLNAKRAPGGREWLRSGCEVTCRRPRAPHPQWARGASCLRRKRGTAEGNGQRTADNRLAEANALSHDGGSLPAVHTRL